MGQLQLRPKRLRYVRASTESGGSTHWFRDETGQRFVGKCAKDSFPWCVANEHVSAQLARLIDLDVPDFSLHLFEGRPYFLSTVLDLPSGKELRDRILRCGTFRAEFARVLAFDVWVMNRDRHFGNFLIRREGDHHHVVAFDHDRTLLNAGTHLRKLEERDEQPPEHLLHGHVEALLKSGRLALPVTQVLQGVDRIVSAPPGDVCSIVRRLPDAVIEPEGKEALERVLLSRQRRLPELARRLMAHPPLRSAFVQPAPAR